MPYWYYEKEALMSTPSVQDGINFYTECTYRKEGSQLIKNICMKMDLPIRNTAATGVIYFHRFYMNQSFSEFPAYVTACCCLFLAGKVEETPKKCKHIIKIAKKLLDSEKFAVFGKNPVQKVMVLEKILLQTIKFDLIVQHPYKSLMRYVRLNMNKILGEKKKISRMVNMAWIFINDSLSTTLPIQWEPQIIAIAVMHLAGKLNQLNLMDLLRKKSNHLRWWDGFVEDLRIEVVEDICHQILDIYVPIQNQNNVNLRIEKEMLTSKVIKTIGPPEEACDLNKNIQDPLLSQSTNQKNYNEFEIKTCQYRDSTVDICTSDDLKNEKHFKFTTGTPNFNKKNWGFNNKFLKKQASTNHEKYGSRNSSNKNNELSIKNIKDYKISSSKRYFHKIYNKPKNKSFDEIDNSNQENEQTDHQNKKRCYYNRRIITSNPINFDEIKDRNKSWSNHNSLERSPNFCKKFSETDKNRGFNDQDDSSSCYKNKKYSNSTTDDFRFSEECLISQKLNFENSEFKKESWLPQKDNENKTFVKNRGSGKRSWSPEKHKKTIFAENCVVRNRSWSPERQNKNKTFSGNRGFGNKFRYPKNQGINKKPWYTQDKKFKHKNSSETYKCHDKPLSSENWKLHSNILPVNYGIKIKKFDFEDVPRSPVDQISEINNTTGKIKSKDKSWSPENQKLNSTVLPVNYGIQKKPWALMKRKSSDNNFSDTYRFEDESWSSDNQVSKFNSTSVKYESKSKSWSRENQKLNSSILPINYGIQKKSWAPMKRKSSNNNFSDTYRFKDGSWSPENRKFNSKTLPVNNGVKNESWAPLNKKFRSKNFTESYDSTQELSPKKKHKLNSNILPVNYENKSLSLMKQNDHQKFSIGSHGYEEESWFPENREVGSKITSAMKEFESYNSWEDRSPAESKAWSPESRDPRRVTQHCSSNKKGNNSNKNDKCRI